MRNRCATDAYSVGNRALAIGLAVVRAARRDSDMAGADTGMTIEWGDVPRPDLN
jgi:hypothetical protein